MSALGQALTRRRAPCLADNPEQRVAGVIFGFSALHGWLLAAGTAVALLTACGSSHDRYLNHMERGRQFLAAGDSGRAGVEFRNALQLQPRDAEALYLSGRVSEQRGSARDAVGFYQAAIEAAPQALPARANLARLFVFAGAAERALDVVGPGLQLHPDDPSLLAARAAARHQLKDDLAARADAERAVRESPTNEDAVAVLAGLYMHASDGPRAAAVVGDAVAKLPTSAVLRQMLSAIYLSLGQPDRAEEQLRRIVALEPGELPARLQLVDFLMQVRRPDDAQRVLETAVRELPKSDTAKLDLANFLATQRSREQGEQILRAFIVRDPSNAGLRFGLAALLQRSGATEEALAAYRGIITREGTGPQGLIARDRMAALEVATQHAADAKKLISQVLDIDPRDNDALILRAQIELEQPDDPAAAIADLRAVLQDQPQSIPVRRALARGYEAKNEPALAEETLRLAMETAPADIAVRTDLALLLLHSQREAQAVTLLQDTITRFPQSSAAREMLIRADLGRSDLPAARAAADDLKTLLPHAAVGFYLAGLVAQEQKRLDDAQQNFERALELQPADAEALIALARLEVVRGKQAQAIARVQRAVDANPKDVAALDLLGQLYLANGDLPRATQSLTHATGLAPDWWMAHRDLALVRLSANDTAGAIREYELAVKLAPQEPALTVALATLYEKEGRIDAAIARYAALYVGDQRMRQLAGNNLAMLLVTYKTDAASLARARALASDFETSEDGALLDTQGWVRFKCGEFSAAVAELQRAALRAPNSKVTRYHLGMAELRTGQRERARTDLEFALSGAASFAGAQEARQMLASLKGADAADAALP
jgi:tetratricopeptide (TPR) repeat protein